MPMKSFCENYTMDRVLHTGEEFFSKFKNTHLSQIFNNFLLLVGNY